MSRNIQLLAEWSPQEAVLLSWPDKYTDWQPWLLEVRQVYLDIISNLSNSDLGVILLVREAEIEKCKKLLPKSAKVLIIKADYNDTWIRDYGFVTCSGKSHTTAIEFIFNGWGEKFSACKDNKINQLVLAPLCQHPIQPIELVVEGGALEIDEDGVLLSTALCLTNKKRNGDFSLSEYKQVFAEKLGATRTVIFESGHLEGDDTDGHIDTLVRFTPSKGLVIQTAYNRPDDPHFSGLSALVKECQLAFPNHAIYQLPLPNIINDADERLPASYANFLISNQLVLCPIYQQPEDDPAIKTLQTAFPNHKVVPINCLPLVQQFGSLHCITMQIPKGTLKPDIIQKFTEGVSQIEQ